MVLKWLAFLLVELASGRVFQVVLVLEHAKIRRVT